jgi:hypothetical protein
MVDRKTIIVFSITEAQITYHCCDFIQHFSHTVNGKSIARNNNLIPVSDEILEMPAISPGSGHEGSGTNDVISWPSRCFAIIFFTVATAIVLLHKIREFQWWRIDWVLAHHQQVDAVQPRAFRTKQRRHLPCSLVMGMQASMQEDL